MKQLEYIKERPILKHLILGILFIFIATSLLSFVLKIYTKHNSTFKTPDFSGVKISDLEEFASDKDVYYKIIDSVYMPKFPMGAVYDQNPKPGAPIKPGRTIYLTVTTRFAEKIKMPNLVDLPLKQALDLLETYGLKAGRIEYVPDIAENAVLKQQHNGREIKPEDLIERGSFINLVVGRGLSNEDLTIPSLIGEPRGNALRIISENHLNIGSEKYEDGADSLKCYVIRQNPSTGTETKAGSSIDLWYGPNKIETPNIKNDESIDE